MKLGFIGAGLWARQWLSIWHAPVIELHVTTIGPVADEDALYFLAGGGKCETARQVTEFADIIFI